jgi:hypothetical protein
LKWVLYSHSFQISFGVAYDNRNREGHRFQQAQVQVEESVRASGSGCRQRISDDRLHHRRRPSAQRRDTEKSREDEAIQCSKGGLSTKIHATTDALGSPIGFHRTARQACDLDGADVLPPAPKSESLLSEFLDAAECRSTRQAMGSQIAAASQTLQIPFRSAASECCWMQISNLGGTTESSFPASGRAPGFVGIKLREPALEICVENLDLRYFV